MGSGCSCYIETRERLRSKHNKDDVLVISSKENKNNNEKDIKTFAISLVMPLSKRISMAKEKSNKKPTLSSNALTTKTITTTTTTLLIKKNEEKKKNVTFLLSDNERLLLKETLLPSTMMMIPNYNNNNNNNKSNNGNCNNNNNINNINNRNGNNHVIPTISLTPAPLMLSPASSVGTPHRPRIHSFFQSASDLNNFFSPKASLAGFAFTFEQSTNTNTNNNNINNFSTSSYINIFNEFHRTGEIVIHLGWDRSGEIEEEKQEIESLFEEIIGKFYIIADELGLKLRFNNICEKDGNNDDNDDDDDDDDDNYDFVKISMKTSTILIYILTNKTAMKPMSSKLKENIEFVVFKTEANNNNSNNAKATLVMFRTLEFPSVMENNNSDINNGGVNQNLLKNHRELYKWQKRIGKACSTGFRRCCWFNDFASCFDQIASFLTSLLDGYKKFFVDIDDKKGIYSIFNDHSYFNEKNYQLHWASFLLNTTANSHNIESSNNNIDKVLKLKNLIARVDASIHCVGHFSENENELLMMKQSISHLCSALACDNNNRSSNHNLKVNANFSNTNNIINNSNSNNEMSLHAPKPYPNLYKAAIINNNKNQAFPPSYNGVINGNRSISPTPTSPRGSLSPLGSISPISPLSPMTNNGSTFNNNNNNNNNSNNNNSNDVPYFSSEIIYFSIESCNGGCRTIEYLLWYLVTSFCHYLMRDERNINSLSVNGCLKERISEFHKLIELLPSNSNLTVVIDGIDLLLLTNSHSSTEIIDLLFPSSIAIPPGLQFVISFHNPLSQNEKDKKNGIVAYLDVSSLLQPSNNNSNNNSNNEKKYNSNDNYQIYKLHNQILHDDTEKQSKTLIKDVFDILPIPQSLSTTLNLSQKIAEIYVNTPADKSRQKIMNYCNFLFDLLMHAAEMKKLTSMKIIHLLSFVTLSSGRLSDVDLMSLINIATFSSSTSSVISSSSSSSSSWFINCLINEEWCQICNLLCRFGILLKIQGKYKISNEEFAIAVEKRWLKSTEITQFFHKCLVEYHVYCKHNNNNSVKNNINNINNNNGWMINIGSKLLVSTNRAQNLMVPYHNLQINDDLFSFRDLFGDKNLLERVFLNGDGIFHYFMNKKNHSIAIENICLGLCNASDSLIIFASFVILLTEFHDVVTDKSDFASLFDNLGEMISAHENLNCLELKIKLNNNNDHFDNGRLEIYNGLIDGILARVESNTRNSNNNIFLLKFNETVMNFNDVRYGNFLSTVVMQGIGDDEVSILSKCLNLNVVKTLILSDGNITSIGCKIISSSLFLSFPNQCVITYLDLGNNSIDNSGAIFLAESLNSFGEKREKNYPSNNNISIFLFGNKIGDDGAKSFGTLLSIAASSKNKNITVNILRLLDLSCNNITEVGLNCIDSSIEDSFENFIGVALWMNNFDVSKCSVKNSKVFIEYTQSFDILIEESMKSTLKKDFFANSVRHLPSITYVSSFSNNNNHNNNNNINHIDQIGKSRRARPKNLSYIDVIVSTTNANNSLNVNDNIGVNFKTMILECLKRNNLQLSSKANAEKAKPKGISYYEIFYDGSLFGEKIEHLSEHLRISIEEFRKSLEEIIDICYGTFYDEIYGDDAQRNVDDNEIEDDFDDINVFGGNNNNNNSVEEKVGDYKKRKESSLRQHCNDMLTTLVEILKQFFNLKKDISQIVKKPFDYIILKKPESFFSDLVDELYFQMSKSYSSLSLRFIARWNQILCEFHFQQLMESSPDCHLFEIFTNDYIKPFRKIYDELIVVPSSSRNAEVLEQAGKSIRRIEKIVNDFMSIIIYFPLFSSSSTSTSTASTATHTSSGSPFANSKYNNFNNNNNRMSAALRREHENLFVKIFPQIFHQNRQRITVTNKEFSNITEVQRQQINNLYWEISDDTKSIDNLIEFASQQLNFSSFSSSSSSSSSSSTSSFSSFENLKEKLNVIQGEMMKILSKTKLESLKMTMVQFLNHLSTFEMILKQFTSLQEQKLLLVARIALMHNDNFVLAQKAESLCIQIDQLSNNVITENLFGFHRIASSPDLISETMDLFPQLIRLIRHLSYMSKYKIINN